MSLHLSLEFKSCHIAEVVLTYSLFVLNKMVIIDFSSKDRKIVLVLLEKPVLLRG